MTLLNRLRTFGRWPQTGDRLVRLRTFGRFPLSASQEIFIRVKGLAMSVRVKVQKLLIRVKGRRIRS